MGNCLWNPSVVTADHFPNADADAAAKADENEDEKVKKKAKHIVRVMKADGTVMELAAPVKAEAIMRQYPQHKLFLRSRAGEAVHSELPVPVPADTEHSEFPVSVAVPADTDHSEFPVSVPVPADTEHSEIPVPVPVAADADLVPGRVYHLVEGEWPVQPPPEALTRVSQCKVRKHRCRRRPRSKKKLRADAEEEGESVWHVRLVVSRQQLEHILSQDANTEDLVHSMRTVAKCSSSASSNSFSSTSSSRRRSLPPPPPPAASSASSWLRV